MCADKGSMRTATPEERKALGIPPAYTDVRIAEDPAADLIATARIPNGKTFYKYSKAFVERQALRKWNRVAKLGSRVERIERTIERDCRNGENRDVAMCARLVLLTGMRNGGAPQGKDVSYGASSLLLEHVRVAGTKLTFDFVGKKGVPQHYELEDALLAGYVRERSSELKLFPHDANATLRYMKSIGAAKVHDIRTWRANAIASALVAELTKDGVPETKRELKALQRAVAERVGSALGNKPSQALKSYIDPRTWTKL